MAEDLYRDETPVDQLLPECKAMARYAFTAGKKIKPVVMGKLARVEMSVKALRSGEPAPSEGRTPDQMASLSWADCAAD